MLAILAKAFVLGLAAAPICALTCAPVFLPMVLSREDARLRSNAFALGEFLLGRLIGYAALGLLLGWLGGALGAEAPRWPSVIACAVLGAALLLYAASETTHEGAFCRLVRRWGRGGSFPLLLGFLTGANICVPFVAAMKDVLELGSPWRGLAFFLSFFAATSLASLPMLVVAFGNLLEPVRLLGRAACGVAGFLFLCAAAGGAAPLIGVSAEVTLVKPEPAFLQQMLPAAKEFREKGKPVRHFVGLDSGRSAGIVAFSTDLAPEVRGFNGPAPVAVALDMEGRIVDVRVLPSQETLGYVRRIYAPEFAAQFKGKPYSAPMSPGQGVDGVTGATVTARAVADGVQLTARRAAETVLGLEAKIAQAPARMRVNRWHLIVPLFFAAAWFAEARRIRWLRFVLLAAAVLCLGIWLRAFFSVRYIVDIGALDIPSFRTNPIWYFLVIPALGLAVLAGRLYCAYICPFGAATEFLGRLSGSPLRVSADWDRRLRRVKYAVLLAAPLLYLLSRNDGVFLVEPFSDTFTFGFLGAAGDASLRIGWLMFLGVASLLVFRFFCRYLCPAGAAMAFLARHRLLGRIRPEGCAECGECMVSCPKGTDRTSNIERPTSNFERKSSMSDVRRWMFEVLRFRRR